jgi:hypothetical protein
MPSGVRLGLAAAVMLLLVSGVACSSDSGTGPSPSPTLSANPGPTSAAPGPTDTPTSTLPPPATTPVPPPTPGDVNSTVEAKPEESKKPVKLDKPSKTGTGLTAELVTISPIEAKAQLPGEVAGPAVAITVQVTNTGSKSADLGSVVVSLADSDDAPGTEMTAEPAKPFKGSVGAGKSVRGVYVFTVAKSKRDPVTLTVSIGDAPVLVFTGDAG